MIHLMLLVFCAQAAPQDKTGDQEERILELERKVQDLEKEQARTVSANPATVLNPTLTVVGDFLARFDDRRVYVDDDPAADRIDDTINVREMEFDLRSAIDPYADGVAIVAVESESPGEFDVAVEEFYAVLKSLPVPFWETPPLGTQIKVGKFRSEFGLNNRSHTHDLPQVDRPLAIQEFLGPEGHASTGISTTSFLPSPGDTALQLTLQLIQGGDINVAPDERAPACLSNVNLFVPIADEHSVNLALIEFFGTSDEEAGDRSRVDSVEVLYKWKPLRQGSTRSFLVGGQLFHARHEFEIDTDADGVTDASERTSPVGVTAFSQVQLSARLYVGTRWDRTDFLVDDSSDTSRIMPYATWYSSEFLRFRASYGHTRSDDPMFDGADSVWLEMTVVFGAHPPEPYWVNK